MSFEKLRVYQAAVELRKEVDRLRDYVKPQHKNLFKHVDEAVDSIKNNIAEGSDSIHPAKRISFYDIANGSAREARSGISSIHDRHGFGEAKAMRAIMLTVTISKMLIELIRKSA